MSTNRDNKKLIVAVVGSDDPETSSNQLNSIRKDRPCIQLHRRKDPCTKEPRLYAVKPASDPQKVQNNSKELSKKDSLLEIQSLPAQEGGGDGDDDTYVSFLVKSKTAAQVSGHQGNQIYAITSVDPLFFLFPEEKESSDDGAKNRHQWQPMDQILATATDPIVRSCLDPRQLSHLYATMKLGPDETVYKFSPVRALAWLKRKQQVLHQFLVKQHQDKKKVNSSNNTTATSTSSPSCVITGGAFSEGFHIPEDAREANQQQKATPTTASDDEIRKAEEIAKEESIQIVCSYLGQEWKKRFLVHLDAAEEVLQSPKQRAAKRSRSDTGSFAVNSNTTATTSCTTDWVQQQAEPPPEKKRKKEQATSAGVKRLAKVSTKGMKKMSSFFSVSTKSKKKA